MSLKNTYPKIIFVTANIFFLLLLGVQGYRFAQRPHDTIITYQPLTLNDFDDTVIADILYDARTLERIGPALYQTSMPQALPALNKWPNDITVRETVQISKNSFNDDAALLQFRFHPAFKNVNPEALPIDEVFKKNIFKKYYEHQTLVYAYKIVENIENRASVEVSEGRVEEYRLKFMEETDNNIKIHLSQGYSRDGLSLNTNRRSAIAILQNRTKHVKELQETVKKLKIQIMAALAQKKYLQHEEFKTDYLNPKNDSEMAKLITFLDFPGMLSTQEDAPIYSIVPEVTKRIRTSPLVELALILAFYIVFCLMYKHLSELARRIIK